MSEKSPSRKNFLKYLGLSAGATVLSTPAISAFVPASEILKLNPAQQEFMQRYGQWMDEFIEVIRIKKGTPDSPENNARMLALSEKSLAWKPELAGFMKDGAFSMVYLAAIERMSKEI